MKFNELDPPRTFHVGDVEIADVGRIELDADEQVTFTTSSGAEWDVARKAWGFYATPSLNDRLPASGLRPALVRAPSGKVYLLLTEPAVQPAFDAYVAAQELEILGWLDDPAFIEKLA